MYELDDLDRQKIHEYNLQHDPDYCESVTGRRSLYDPRRPSLSDSTNYYLLTLGAIFLATSFVLYRFDVEYSISVWVVQEAESWQWALGIGIFCLVGSFKPGLIMGLLVIVATCVVLSEAWIMEGNQLEVRFSAVSFRTWAIFGGLIAFLVFIAGTTKTNIERSLEDKGKQFQ